MYILPTVIIQFNNEIEPRAIPFFRGAVIASLADKSILFHNHDDDKLRYSYPLIQYKLIHKKAAVMGIGKGVEEASRLLAGGDFNYQIGNEAVEMLMESVNAHDNEIAVSAKADRHYRLHNWLPLNSKNYIRYQDAEGMLERIQMLERILVGNILSFLKGVDIFLMNQLVVHITDITGQRDITYKNVKLKVFDVAFKTNISLPPYIGIGKNASIGCGVLTKITNP